MKSRRKIIIASVILVASFVIQFVLMGYTETWNFWSVPEIRPILKDLRTITHGGDSYEMGYDPMYENPADPGGVRMNYPRIWQVLYLLGINQNHTIPIGILFAILFFVGLCLLLPNQDWITILLTMVSVLSPAVLLCLERGNTDAFLFFLITLAVVLFQDNEMFAAIIIAISFIFKLIFNYFL